MNELPIHKTDQIRYELKLLIQESGYVDHPLFKQIEEVLIENERLRLEVARLRRSSAAQGSSMSSKLRDALRE